MSEPGKQPESAKQLAAAEEESRARFEKAMNELRDGAYRFASRARGQSELVVEELIDPEGETVASIAEVEGDQGAVALAQSLELITFDTWLFGQIGDKEELDLKAEDHWEVWFTFGAWIGETIRRRHGGHWLLMGDDPHTWRVGFSKVFLEIAPFVFAEQLLRMGSGRDAQDGHGDRAHPAGPRGPAREGQRQVARSVRGAALHPAAHGAAGAVDVDGLREARAPVERGAGDRAHRVAEGERAAPRSAERTGGRAGDRGDLAREPDAAIAKQTNDRGLFEAISQIIALRRVTQPIAIDILERVVMPAMHVGLPETFPPLDEDDLANLRKGIEMFAFFVEVIPHKYQADDEGFLGTIPHEQLTTPYADRNVLEIGKGDWVVVNPAHFAPMLAELDPQALLDKFDEFVKYLAANPDAPRRRDDGRLLAETAIRALADLKVTVATAAENNDALLFRLLPRRAELSAAGRRE